MQIRSLLAIRRGRPRWAQRTHVPSREDHRHPSWRERGAGGITVGGAAGVHVGHGNWKRALHERGSRDSEQLRTYDHRDGDALSCAWLAATCVVIRLAWYSYVYITIHYRDAAINTTDTCNLIRSRLCDGLRPCNLPLRHVIGPYPRSNLGCDVSLIEN